MPGGFDPLLLSPTKGSPAGGKPQMPGWEGLPFYGGQVNVREDDPEHKKPQIASRVHVEILVLSDEEQMKRYTDVMQMVANGYALISQEERQYDTELKTWRVLLRWIELFTFMPKQVDR